MIAFTYATDGLISRVSWSTLGSAYRTNSYDSLNRLTKNSLSVSAPTNATKSELNTQYTYLTNGTNATGLVSRLKYTNLFEGHSSLGSGEFALRTFDYTYDANGNIKTVTTDGVLTDSYTYDGLNQLVRHDDAAAGKSYVYSYDAGGNITSKKEYVYTTGTLGTVLSEKSYAYDSVWKDKLVSYDGKAITYDEIGNPLTFDGYTFSWQKGRQLASIDGNGVSLDFKYNSDGLRTKKISSDKTIEYYYSGSVLMAQYDGTNWLKFCYSADGEIVGFEYNNTPYYFVKNLQGDIVGIMNSASELVCTYKYDAWGKCTVYDSSGAVNTSSTFIGNVNPIRYRGYYYDAETGLYYVSSRYYNPNIVRFISPDTTDVLTATPMVLTDKNLFAYCDNNPVIRADYRGDFWHIVAGAVIGGVFELGSQLLSGEEVNWSKVVVATLVGGVTSAVGPLAGAIISGAANITLDMMSGERNIKKLVVSGVVGAGASLIGSGLGELVKKAGGNIATRTLGKMSKSNLKKTVVRLVPTINGAERNAIKNISYLTSNYSTIGTQYFMSSHFGKTLTTSIGQVGEGFVGSGASCIKKRWFAL